ncbi:MAG: sensor histidine kinase [Leptothrix sp. (in: b-proteobacteria)]
MPDRLTAVPWLHRFHRPTRSRAGGSAPYESFNLTRWFAAVSLASIALLAGAIGFALDHFVTTRQLRQQAELTAEFVNSLMDVEAPMRAYLLDPSHAMLPETDRSFDHISLMPNVLRANAYDRTRRVIWSSDDAQLGRLNNEDPELDEAMRGGVVLHRGHDFVKNGIATPEEVAMEDRLYLEIYVPVFNSAGTEVIGVVEFYELSRGLAASLRELRHYIVAGGVVGAVFLYLALFQLIRRADRTIRHQQDQLVGNEMLAVIGEMSTAVAHGIRNPLASIRSSAEMVQIGSAHRAQEAASDVISECDRLESWVNELLSYTRAQNTQASAVSLPEVIGSCLSEADRELGRRGIAVQTDWATDLPAVRAHPLLLGQVLRSLLANAMEASSGGAGQIHLQARSDAPHRQVHLTLSDDGPGISRAHLGQVGQPFFTTKPRGLGVGLALARRVVERLGGTLRIDSTPGLGTQVHLHLPAA